MSQQNLKQLTKTWYKKLEDSGFKDIEKNGNLKSSTTNFSSRLNSKSRKISEEHLRQLLLAKQEYYRLAGHFLYEYEFNSELERFIWEKHAEGVSYRSIYEQIKAKKYRCYKDKLLNILETLKLEMFKLYGTNVK